MIRARTTAAFTLLPLVLALLSACGQKGDLRLPPAKVKAGQAPAAASPGAPAEGAPQPPAASPR